MSKRVRRREHGIEIPLREFEAAILTSLVGQLLEILGADGTAGDVDPLKALEGQFRRPSLDTADPVIQRLFPAAYDDAQADAEFRRYAEGEQLQRKIEDADLVLRALESAPEGQPILVPSQETQAWLRTVNALRLSLAVRLGIERPGSRLHPRLTKNDPRTYVLSVYEWLGVLLEILLDALQH